MKCNFSAAIGKKIVIFSLGYLAHVSYDQSKAILTFLEQALLESKHRYTLVTVSFLFNDLANASGSTC